MWFLRCAVLTLATFPTAVAQLQIIQLYPIFICNVKINKVHLLLNRRANALPAEFLRAISNEWQPEIHSHAKNWKFLAYNNFMVDRVEVSQQFAVGLRCLSAEAMLAVPECVWGLFPKTSDDPLRVANCKGLVTAHTHTRARAYCFVLWLH